MLIGDIKKIVLPPIVVSSRSDGLWQHTCFEAFFKRPGGYTEHNFGPSSEWASYQFDSYRAGQKYLEYASCEIGQDSGSDWYELEAWVTFPDGYTLDDPVQLALSAVIEETDGTKSYWALAHPPGAPDFHHPSCFTITLPPPSEP